MTVAIKSTEVNDRDLGKEQIDQLVVTPLNGCRLLCVNCKQATSGFGSARSPASSLTRRPMNQTFLKRLDTLHHNVDNSTEVYEQTQPTIPLYYNLA